MSDDDLPLIRPEGYVSRGHRRDRQYADMRTVLVRVQWAAVNSSHAPICPICGACAPGPHGGRCDLGRLLNDDT